MHRRPLTDEDDPFAAAGRAEHRLVIPISSILRRGYIVVELAPSFPFLSPLPSII